MEPQERWQLEASFDQAMHSIDERAAREIGYRPTHFPDMLREGGDVATAVALLQPHGAVPEGFTRLALAERLNPSVEHLVLQAPWCGRFDEDVLTVARRRLKRS